MTSQVECSPQGRYYAVYTTLSRCISWKVSEVACIGHYTAQDLICWANELQISTGLDLRLPIAISIRYINKIPLIRLSFSQFKRTNHVTIYFAQYRNTWLQVKTSWFYNCMQSVMGSIRPTAARFKIPLGNGRLATLWGRQVSNPHPSVVLHVCILPCNHHHALCSWF